MRSRFFQLRCHQPHSTLTFSQTEFAFYLDPFALVPVILSLVPILSLLGPSQSWPGKPDSPRFAVAEILTVPVYLICQYPTGVVSLALVEIFNHFLELGRFVVSIKERYSSLVQPSVTLISSFMPNSTGLPTFPRTIGRTKGWLTLTIRFSTLWVWLSYMYFCCS